MQSTNTLDYNIDKTVIVSPSDLDTSKIVVVQNNGNTCFDTLYPSEDGELCRLCLDVGMSLVNNISSSKEGVKVELKTIDPSPYKLYFKLPTNTPRKCNNCKKYASFKCGNCFEVHYCSIECQKKDWSYHKPQCKNKQ
jgi:hypothetical protein